MLLGGEHAVPTGWLIVLSRRSEMGGSSAMPDNRNVVKCARNEFTVLVLYQCGP